MVLECLYRSDGSMWCWNGNQIQEQSVYIFGWVVVKEATRAELLALCGLLQFASHKGIMSLQVTGDLVVD